jgi:hypothetical protein
MKSLYLLNSRQIFAQEIVATTRANEGLATPPR